MAQVNSQGTHYDRLDETSNAGPVPGADYVGSRTLPVPAEVTFGEDGHTSGVLPSTLPALSHCQHTTRAGGSQL